MPTKIHASNQSISPFDSVRGSLAYRAYIPFNLSPYLPPISHNFSIALYWRVQPFHKALASCWVSYMSRPWIRIKSQYTISIVYSRRAISSVSKWSSLRRLHDGGLDTFRREAFIPAQPALLPVGCFNGLPAMQKWFSRSKDGSAGTILNQPYLTNFGDAIVPLEFSRHKPAILAEGARDSFQRAEAPLQIFLEWAKYANLDTPERFYVAQASFASLPQAMINDLPTPEIVAKAGTGDIYDTNLWLGIAPTYTPLHRDPSPNLFVQLAGHKIVRMLSPEAGDRVFARVQRHLGKSGSASFRGEEMMKGEERKFLEAEVWDDESQLGGEGDQGYEAHVWDGDGVFIPKGWWHSVKGVGGDVLGSVNWWFR